MNFIMIYHFYLTESKLKKLKSLLLIDMIKLNMSFTSDHALNHGLFLEKVHRVIKFYQKAWLKPHTNMNKS